ncbi:hypothetical protein GLAREA_01453 [Glarea lozoyensis ATCC 20868]|uniref:Uncharacterized protein n=1 Tax=Glarea lozoyensis (strain ATCC 20868 / MF5171) TaxID=1116229 RepID=S3D0F7_GLAL2|nr:uncharacterized protein GLAREA_01453 [Glarea lozoyensis ATCC 20868]EPE25541.1 hypothetical protein GLAREA_01453 [Glarea lozoyensis ATCC 20868]
MRSEALPDAQAWDGGEALASKVTSEACEWLNRWRGNMQLLGFTFWDACNMLVSCMVGSKVVGVADEFAVGLNFGIADGGGYEG